MAGNSCRDTDLKSSMKNHGDKLGLSMMNIYFQIYFHALTITCTHLCSLKGLHEHTVCKRQGEPLLLHSDPIKSSHPYLSMSVAHTSCEIELFSIISMHD